MDPRTTQHVVAGALIGALFLGGCVQSGPASPSGGAAESAVAGPESSGAVAASASSGPGDCRAVSGRLIEQGNILEQLSGSLTGDLSGTTIGAYDMSRFRQTGKPGWNFAGHNYGERLWQITGSPVPALVGQTVRLSFTAIATNPEPGFQLLGDWHETAKVEDGAARGNLTLQGTIDGRGGFPTFVFEMSYRGQVCS